MMRLKAVLSLKVLWEPLEYGPVELACGMEFSENDVGGGVEHGCSGMPLAMSINAMAR